MATSLHDVEVRHLSALRAVAEEGTFGRAAARLGYTQSAVSQQIAALEKLVGGSLFERRGGPRPVEITPLGSRLLSHAESVLDRLSAAESDLDLYLAGQIGMISIGTFQSASVRILPHVLRRLREDRPDLEVKLHEEEEESEILSLLRSGRLDVVFLGTPNTDPDLRVVPLIEDPWVIISPRQEIGSGLGGPRIDPAALHGQPLVAETMSSCAAIVEGDLRRHGAQPDVVFRTHDNAAVQAMVRSGMGHSVMPVLAIDTKDPDVRVRVFDPPLPPRQIGVAVQRERAIPPAVEHLIDLTRQVCRELAADSDLLEDLTGTP